MRLGEAVKAERDAAASRGTSLAVARVAASAVTRVLVLAGRDAEKQDAVAEREVLWKTVAEERQAALREDPSRLAFLTGAVRVRLAPERIPTQSQLATYRSWKQFGEVPDGIL